MSPDFYLWGWVCAISLIAALYDTNTQRIPDRLLSLGIIVLGAGLIWALQGPQIWTHLGSGIVGLWIGALFFYFKIMGGGDAKLLSLVSLMVPVDYLLELLLWIFIAGGILALWARFIFKQKAIPYAVAIFGGVFAFGAVRLLIF